MDLTGFVYVCSGGETFDSIAMALWQDEKYAADLLCANPEYCRVQAFDGGERIYVPVVELPENPGDELSSDLDKAPWKE